MNAEGQVEPIHKHPSAREILTANRAVLAIGGMGCPECAMRVRNSLISLEGVYGVDVLLNLALAEVLYDGHRLSASKLRDAVRRAGNDRHHVYDAEMIRAG